MCLVISALYRLGLWVLHICNYKDKKQKVVLTWKLQERVKNEKETVWEKQGNSENVYLNVLMKILLKFTWNTLG